jgi:hypothetical protein
MLTFLFGIFAFFWTAIFATVGVGLFVVFLIPLIILALLFRIGFAIMKLAAGAVLVALLFVCLF